MPYGKWIHVEMSCALGGVGNGYDLNLSVAGEVPPVIKRNLWMHSGFSTLGWMGIISEASGDERFYIDNFRLSASCAERLCDKEGKGK